MGQATQAIECGSRTVQAGTPPGGWWPGAGRGGAWAADVRASHTEKPSVSNYEKNPLTQHWVSDRMY